MGKVGGYSLRIWKGLTGWGEKSGTSLLLNIPAQIVAVSCAQVSVGSSDVEVDTYDPYASLGNHCSAYREPLEDRNLRRASSPTHDEVELNPLTLLLRGITRSSEQRLIFRIPSIKSRIPLWDTCSRSHYFSQKASAVNVL